MRVLCAMHSFTTECCHVCACAGNTVCGPQVCGPLCLQAQLLWAADEQHALALLAIQRLDHCLLAANQPAGRQAAGQLCEKGVQANTPTQFATAVAAWWMLLVCCRVCESSLSAITTLTEVAAEQQVQQHPARTEMLSLSVETICQAQHLPRGQILACSAQKVKQNKAGFDSKVGGARVLGIASLNPRHANTGNNKGE